jgi:DNA repair protein RecN (Recombination protein N)
MEELSGLSMKGTRFAVEFSPASAEDGLTASGADAVRFLISANAGETPAHQPHRLGRRAEPDYACHEECALRREDADTLVFDEVDAGVSGIAAQRVAEKLSDLAADKQVLCVTHLPQIAAMADVHFEIRKSVRDGRTYTSVEGLDMDGRRGELARLIGGENVTETTLASASELIAASESYKTSERAAEAPNLDFRLSLCYDS